jgi:integrase
MRSISTLASSRSSRRWCEPVSAADLPPIRGIHGLRHAYASSALAAGAPVKVVSQRLGHSRVGITLDTYTHALPGADQDVADLVAGVILRRDQSVTTAADDA